MVSVRRLPSALRQLSASLTDILPSVGASLSNALSVRSSPLTDTNKKTLHGGELFYWCRLGDSNARPTHYECVALPTELNRQFKDIHKSFFSRLQALFFLLCEHFAK